MDPLPQRVAEPGQRLAPERAAQHDAARAGRIAEVDQRGGEGLGDRLEPLEARSRRAGSGALSWSVLTICSPRPSLPMTIRQLLARSASGASRSQRRSEDLPVELAHQPGDDLHAHAVLVQHPDQAVDLPRRRPELRQVGRLRRLERDQVRVAGDEGHQVELARARRPPRRPGAPPGDGCGGAASAASRRRARRRPRPTTARTSRPRAPRARPAAPAAAARRAGRWW